MNLLVALFAIASLVWMVPLVQRGRVLAVAMLVLVVGTIFGPDFFSIDGPARLSLDRILWVVMLLILVLGWRYGHARFPSPTRTDWVVLGMVVWFLVSCLRTGAAASEQTPLSRWWFYVAMPAGMYLVARLVAIRARDIDWLVRGLIGLGLYLSITAMLEVTGTHGLVFPRYIIDPEVWQFFGRGRGPLMNPTGNGFLIALCSVACAVAILHAGRRGKALYGVALVILLGGLFATLTRSAWLGGIGGVAIIGFVYSPRWLRVLGLASIVLLVGGSALGVKNQLVRMKRDKNLTAADAEKSVKLRPLLAVVAWEMFKDRPLSGHGFGQYDQRKDRFHTERSYGLPLDQARDYVQHNVFLSALVDTGLIGLGLLLCWLTAVAAIGWSLAHNKRGRPQARSIGLLLLGMLTAYLANGLFHDVLIIPMVHMFLFFVAGVAVTVHHDGLVSGQRLTRRGDARQSVPPVSELTRTVVANTMTPPS